MGADSFCVDWRDSPGLTSPTASLPEENLAQGTLVAVHAHGKTHALAVGKLLMPTDEIKSVNKGVGVENVLWLGDDLWSAGTRLQA